MANFDWQRDPLNWLADLYAWLEDLLNARYVCPPLILILAFFFYALMCWGGWEPDSDSDSDSDSDIVKSVDSFVVDYVAPPFTFPLLDRLLEELPEVVHYFVLPMLNPNALTMLAQVGRRWHAAVLSSGLPRAATPPGIPLELYEFHRFIKHYTRSKLDGTLDVNSVSGMMIRQSYMSEALSVCRRMDIHRRAEEQMGRRSTWGTHICAHAAARGHLDILECARALDYPWGADTCAFAARGGHLDVLKWARSYHCPWDHRTSRCAAQSGSLEVLRWAMDHGVPVDPMQWRWYQRLLCGEPHAISHWRTIPESRLQDWQIYCD